MIFYSTANQYLIFYVEETQINFINIICSTHVWPKAVTLGVYLSVYYKKLKE